MTHVAAPTSARPRRAVKAWIAAGISAILAITGVVALTAPASATDGYTGVVGGIVALPGGSPVGSGDTIVRAWRLDEEAQEMVDEGFTTALAAGAWSFSELPIGKYAFAYDYTGAADVNIVDQFGGGEIFPEQVVFTQNLVTIGQDETWNDTFEFVSGAQLSATVTGTGDLPVAGSEVSVYLWTFDAEGADTLRFLASSTTDGGGLAALHGLPAGEYAAQYTATGYATQLWEGVYGPDPSYGNTFPLVNGDSYDISAQLAVGGHITGTIKGSGGVGLVGVDVTANIFADDTWFNPVATATTGAGGAYDISGLAPGTYRLEADPSPAGDAYLPRVYPAAADLEHGTSIVVGSGATVTGKNITLLKSSTITGKITLAPVSPVSYPVDGDVQILACRIDQPCDLDFGGTFGTYDEITGTYRVTGLTAGKYNLFVAYVGAGNYRDEYYNNVRDQEHAAAIVVGSSATVTGKNVMLDAGSTISGTVTRDGNPVAAGVAVGAYEVLPGGQILADRALRQAETDANGEYTIGGLGDGTYAVRAVTELTPELSAPWYGDSYNDDHAARITLTVPASASGIDVRLEESATITGTIVEADTGDPITDTGVDVYRFDTEGGSYAQMVPNTYTSTDDNGFYTMHVPSGQYLVAADGNAEYMGRTYGAATDAISVQAGIRIDLSAGASTDVSFDLDRGGSYTGRIVDGDGQPIEGAYVDVDAPVDGVDTGSTGTFRMDGLPSGPHRLSILMTDGSSYVARTEVAAPATTYNALPVDLGDILVEAESTITGVVRSTSGSALRGVQVYAYTVGRGGGLESVGITETDTDGSFFFTGLPSESVYLEFDAPGATYQDQFLGGSTVWSLSDAVALPTAGTNARVEARLVTGGAISGVVKNKATGRVVPGVSVGVLRNSPAGEPEWGAGTETNSKGAYLFPGLDAGGYEVFINENEPWLDPLPFTEKVVQVTVADRATTKVNASLVPQSKISGVVKIGPTGVNGVQVTATDANGHTLETVTSATGSYSLPVDVGTWTLFFTDPHERAASAYWKSSAVTGAAASADASTVTVTGNGAGFGGRNITLVAGGGSLTADITANGETDPSGSITLTRVDGACPDVLSSQTIYPPHSFQQPLNDVFPIDNLRAGTYCVTIDGTSNLTDGGGYYDPVQIGTFTITDGATTDLGTIVLPPLTDLSQIDDATLIPGSEPTIGSTPNPTVGEPVFVIGGTWSRGTKYLLYQWTRNGKPIAGAQGSSYWLAPGDAGATIAVRLAATDFPEALADAYSYVATLTLPVQKAPAAVNLGVLPSIAGKEYAGQTLTADPGIWDVPNLTFSYQWLRDGFGIAGATAKTYKLTAADVGAQLSVYVTAARAGFETANETSEPTATIMPALAIKATKLPTAKIVGPDFVVTNGTWSPSGATYAYDWYEYLPSGERFMFSSGTNHVDVASRAPDTRITVVVTASKAGYTSTSVEVQARSGPVPEFVTPPSLSTTTPAVGIPISVDLSVAVASPPLGAIDPGVIDVVSVPTYQWYRNGTKITGATAAAYTPKATDQNATLSVRVTLKATGYATPSGPQSTLVATDPVAATTLTVGSGQQIDGLGVVGRVLTAQTGTWSATPTSFTFQWLRDALPISKATSSTYTPTAQDLGKEITVRITAKLGTQSVSVTTTAVVIMELEIASVTPPVIPTSARVGARLTATAGTWDVAGTTYAYQWYRNDVPITGALTSAYTPIPADLGDELRVGVIAKKTGFPDSVTVYSETVTVELGAAQAATKAPTLTVSGKTVTTVLDGKILSSNGGTWPVAPESLTYRWQWAPAASGPWTDLPGYVDPTLMPEIAADPTSFVAGQYYRVVVTAVRSGYQPGERASAAVRLITAP